MRDITKHIQTYYRYNGKFYIITDRKDFRMHDIFIDGRDYGVKVVESEKDLIDVAFMAPELYVILEEVTVQN